MENSSIANHQHQRSGSSERDSFQGPEDSSGTDLAKMLTPVNEEGLAAGSKGDAARKPSSSTASTAEENIQRSPVQKAKTKPKPLPRKSSLSSQSVDINSSGGDCDEKRSSSSVIVMARGDDGNGGSSAVDTSLEGYGGARPLSVNQGRGLRQQDAMKTDPLENVDTKDGTKSHGEDTMNLNAMAATGALSSQITAASRDTDTVTNMFSETDSEPVQMRRSSSQSNQSNDNNWQGHIFAGKVIFIFKIGFPLLWLKITLAKDV